MILAVPLAILYMPGLCMFGSLVLFTQEWPVPYGSAFRTLKFRTMTEALDRSGVLLPSHLCPTHYGRVLRFAGPDGLPRLWDVSKGGMSLVGCRVPYRVP